MEKPERKPVLYGIIGILLPFLCPLILRFFVDEPEEAIGSGFFLGSALAAIIGVKLLISNREHKLKAVKILGVIDVVPFCILAVLVV